MTLHFFHKAPPDPPKDALERLSHGVLGTLLGLGAAILFWLMRDPRRELIIAAFVAFPLLGGAAAMKWGDRFWNWLRGHQ